MSYYVESDGDRTPKDVYICDGSERVLTMECASEDRRFRLARRICVLLNSDRFEELTNENIWKLISELNADPTLDDVKVMWAGQTVHIMSPKGDMLTVMEADTKVLSKVIRWCVKNRYRCTKIHDGRIWI